MSTELLAQATTHVKAIVFESLELKTRERVLVVFDTQSPLSCLLTEAFRAVTPEATYIDFDQVTPASIFASIDTLTPGDLVVLIQSSNFRLNEFRIRIELFKRGLKTIELPHLERMPEEQWQAYIDSLAYNRAEYQRFAHGLRDKLKRAERVELGCEGTTLVFEGGLEEPKLNIGDYTGMENVGGTFPIGEVFTENKDLSRVNGEAMVFAFAGDDHHVNIHQPFHVIIQNGILTPGTDAPESFVKLIETIRASEPVQVREFGLGLNKAIGKDRILNDITAFERQEGVHLSLGLKHSVFKKEGIVTHNARYHIDIFVDVTSIKTDKDVLFVNGEFQPE